MEKIKSPLCMHIDLDSECRIRFRQCTEKIRKSCELFNSISDFFPIADKPRNTERRTFRILLDCRNDKEVKYKFLDNTACNFNEIRIVYHALQTKTFLSNDEKYEFIKRFVDEIKTFNDKSVMHTFAIEWAKEKERVKVGGAYYFVSSFGTVFSANDHRAPKDDGQFDTGNYFKSIEECEEYAEKIKELFKENK